MRWFFKAQKDNSTHCVICFTANGMTVAHQTSLQALPQLTYLECCQARRLEVLSTWVKQQKLQQVQTTWVLNPNEYQLLSKEALNVPRAELAEAVRWRISDMIDFPIVEAACDAFLIPPHGPAHGRKLMTVVVAKQAELQARRNLIQQAGLQLTTIDITEMALRNLILKQAITESGVAGLYFCAGIVGIVICAGGELFLSRHLDVDLASLSANASLEDTQPLLDKLADEVQRSIDYYQSHMGQSAPSKCLLAPSEFAEQLIGAYLGKSLSLPIEKLNVEPWFEMTQNGQSLLAEMLPAMGGVWRKEEVANATS